MTLHLIGPRGFCAGVVRAIKTVETALEVFEKPIYVKHAIVHNQHVISDLENKGAIFVEELSEIPDGSTVIFSAHGVSKAVFEEAKFKNLKVIDATCGLVTRVHSAANRYAEKGYQILIIGHKNHVEIQGTIGWAKNQATVIENLEDVEKLSFEESQPIFLTTQTTLSLLDVEKIQDRILSRYPQTVTLPKGSICYATTNRQKALLAISDQVDGFIVIGDPTSSNSKRLYELALSTQKEAVMIHSLSDLKDDFFYGKKNIGLTAGASTPDHVIDTVVEHITSHLHFSCKIFNHIEENVQFALPKELAINH